MSRTIVMRELKTGGFSPCVAKEENVGKRRCNHVPSNLSFKLKRDKLGTRLERVVIPQEFLDMAKKDKVKFAASLVDTLEPVNKQKADKVVKQLREL